MRRRRGACAPCLVKARKLRVSPSCCRVRKRSMPSMPSVADKRRTFRKLHEQGCFVIPNPWDIGTARYLQHLGFKALASTSAGFAFSEGYADNAITRDMALAHLRELVAATDVPV